VDSLRTGSSKEPYPKILFELRTHLDEIFKVTSIKFQIDTHYSSNNVDLAEYVQLGIIHIIMEIAGNIIKHSKAKNVNAVIEWSISHFKISIFDDGVGMSKRHMNSKRGVEGIRDKAKRIGGTVSMVSHQNNGTVVDIDIVLSNNKVNE
jgi:signal transduction histidine kinase